MSKQFVLYGIAGPSDMYRVVQYWIVENDDYTIADIVRIVRKMIMGTPSIKEVYAIDQRRGLRRDYIDAVRSNSIEGWMIFRDILEREGLSLG